MPALPASSRPAGVPGRVLAALVALVAGLAVAFVVAPPRLAGGDLADHGHLVAAFRTAMVGYWRSGDRNYPPDLQRVVDYWFRFHLIKGGIAVLLLIVLSALTVLIWRTFLRTDGLGAGGRAALVSAGTVAAMLALFALAVVMANVQGALAPFASLFPMLIGGSASAGLAGALAQGRHQLAGSHRTGGYTPPALDAMVSDFGRYHAVMAVIAVVVAIALLALSATCWVSRARSADRRTRRVLGWFGAGVALSSLLVAVVLIANAGVASDPAPALLGLFNGGF